VHVETWQSAYRGIVPDDFLDAMSIEQRLAAYDEDMLATPEQPMWVAERDRIVGFASAGPSRDAEGEGELYAIYVDASQWGRGTGDALMGVVLDHLRPRFEAATLWVLEANVRARRFYEKYGWAFDGTVEDFARADFVLPEVRYRIDLT
jgi:GNAT superfamily N-acetyltransferase